MVVLFSSVGYLYIHIYIYIMCLDVFSAQFLRFLLTKLLTFHLTPFMPFIMRTIHPSIHPDRKKRLLILMVSLRVSRGRICDDAVHRGGENHQSHGLLKPYTTQGRERVVTCVFFSRTKTSTKRNQSRKNDPFKDLVWGVDPIQTSGTPVQISACQL